MARAVELSAAARPAGPEPTTATRLPVPGRRLGRDPAFLEGAIDDGVFNRLDRHRVAVDGEHAGSLARRRAEATGELGKIIGLVQPVDRVPPSIVVDEIVPVRDQIAERAALMAERDAAVHAARALIAQVLHGIRQYTTPALTRCATGRVAACGAEFDEARSYPPEAPTSSAKAASRFSVRARAPRAHALAVARRTFTNASCAAPGFEDLASLLFCTTCR
jgi:hypothetical protein